LWNETIATKDQNRTGEKVMPDIKILPGQLWLDDSGVWDVYDGEMLYVTCSKEPGDPWVCMRFQEWEFGAQKREFTEDELRKLKYIGQLKDFRK
jgi:hypothetical protein